MKITIKNLILLLCFVVTGMTACKKEAVPDPDYRDAFLGTYVGTMTLINSDILGPYDTVVVEMDEYVVTKIGEGDTIAFNGYWATVNSEGSYSFDFAGPDHGWGYAGEFISPDSVRYSEYYYDGTFESYSRTFFGKRAE